SILQVIDTLAGDRFPPLAIVADRIGMNMRTLQRHLARAGTSCHELVAHRRLGTAMHLLRDTEAKIVDIALDLGYSDHAHFTRAFRKWTGRSPREFRLGVRPQPPPSPGRPGEGARGTLLEASA